MKKFIFLTVAIIVGRVYDAYTPYLLIPDLKGEVNPIVSILGGGWTALIIVQVILLSVILGCLYYYHFHYRPPLPVTQKPVSFKEFSSYISFKSLNSFKRIFYKVPSHKNTTVAQLSYVLSMTLLCISYIVGSSTTLLLLSSAYRNIYRNGGPAVLISIAAFLSIYFLVRFYRREYRRYIKAFPVRSGAIN